MARRDDLLEQLVNNGININDASVNVGVVATGAGGSGGSTYKSPVDFTATYTSSTTITLSSVPFTITDSSQIESIKVTNSSGVTTNYINGADGVSMTVSSNVITISGASPFASGDVYEVSINGQEKSYDVSTNSKNVSVLNPEYAHYTTTEHPVDLTDTAAATYRKIIEMEGYKNGTLHLKGSGGVTFTVWASLDSTADDTADTGWVDISTSILGAASLVDSEGIYFIDTNYVLDRLMIKYVTSDATNAVDVWVKKG